MIYDWQHIFAWSNAILFFVVLLKCIACFYFGCINTKNKHNFISVVAYTYCTLYLLHNIFARSELMLLKPEGELRRYRLILSVKRVDRRRSS